MKSSTITSAIHYQRYLMILVLLLIKFVAARETGSIARGSKHSSLYYWLGRTKEAGKPAPLARGVSEPLASAKHHYQLGFTSGRPGLPPGKAAD